jgi:hypothetical protein
MLQSNFLLHSHEINGKLGGTSFKSGYKKWANDPMVDAFTSWTAKSFG